MDNPLSASSDTPPPVLEGVMGVGASAQTGCLCLLPQSLVTWWFTSVGAPHPSSGLLVEDELTVAEQVV